MLMCTAILVGGCSESALPDVTKLPQPVLNRPQQLDTIKAMNQTAQTHRDEAAKKIEEAK